MVINCKMILASEEDMKELLKKHTFACPEPRSARLERAMDRNARLGKEMDWVEENLKDQLSLCADEILYVAKKLLEREA